MTGYLAGTLSVTGYLGRHAAWFSVRQVVVALIFIAVLLALLVGPLLLEPLGNLFSKGVKKAAPGGFVLGLVVLLIGLASGVRFITIAGAAVAGAVVLGFIIDNYLTPGGGHRRQQAGRGIELRAIARKADRRAAIRRYPGGHADRRAVAHLAAFRGCGCTPSLSRARARARS